MKNALKVAALAALGFVVGCTDASWGKFTALGDSAAVECWSGGQLIYKGRSTGKVRSEANSDGYFFVDAKDGLTKEVSGNCIISYGDKSGSDSLTGGAR